MLIFRRYLSVVIVALFLLIVAAPEAKGALLWKDDFTDELFSELTWDTKNTTGTPEIKNERCILKIEENDKGTHEAIGTLESHTLPPNFDLFAALEFTNVQGGKGEFYIQIGGRMELLISFQDKPGDKVKKGVSAKTIFCRKSNSNQYLPQASKAKGIFTHQISSGDRCYIRWMSNGESPSLQIIKVGSNPGESDIGDFLIETDKPLSGNVEFGIRNGLKEVRINHVRAYLFGTSSSLVHDWVLF